MHALVLEFIKKFENRIIENIKDIKLKITGNDPYTDGWNKGALQALKHLNKRIKEGFFDWQQGSE